jgi:hypothetical protein
MQTKTWRDALGDPTIADAICNRLVHNGHVLKLGGPSIRKRKHWSLNPNRPDPSSLVASLRSRSRNPERLLKPRSAETCPDSQFQRQPICQRVSSSTRNVKRRSTRALRLGSRPQPLRVAPPTVCRSRRGRSLPTGSSARHRKRHLVGSRDGGPARRLPRYPARYGYNSRRWAREPKRARALEDAKGVREPPPKRYKWSRGGSNP